MRDYYAESLALHQKLRGKISISAKINLRTTDDLALAYSPGVAEPCRAIAENPSSVWDLTIKNNTVAVITDGSAVLGLGNIGTEAALPVMEGKCLLLRKFADIDAFPICLDTQDTDEIVETIRRIAPVFGGINLEDIAAPRCFDVEERLQDLGIPVFHDDQHGTAIVVLAALYNACKLYKKDIHEMKIVINGAGAAGIAIARLLTDSEFDPENRQPVKDVLVCDSQGIIHHDRADLSPRKKVLLKYVNPENKTGTLKDAIKDADVFIGVSLADLLTVDDIKTMADNPVILALANPDPEIMPEDAYKGGAGVVGTGRSDFPNQVNNVLAFPGIFRGALNVRAKRITPRMKLAAAYAIARCVHPDDLSKDLIIPNVLDKSVGWKVAEAVMKAYVPGE
ncbi:MAG: NADP-dependent malic enzyme [Bacteroidetes bacterium]|nr:NADP-dependent malic enzyme [Bacteroidota bacterium]